MRVFNLAEELEKERKKNKELEERNEVLEKGCKEYRYHIKQMNKIHDNCLNTIEELQDKVFELEEQLKLAKEQDLYGIKVFTNNETYKEYKGTLQDQINELQDRIDSAINYIEENCYDEERKMVINELYDEIPELLNILEGSDNNDK